MAPEATPSPPKREMKVLCLGLFRTGSYSMYTALTTLGYANVYHGLNSLGVNDDWVILNAAADATFPSLPTYRGPEKPFSRAEWDAIFGSCEAVTDVASVFGPALIDAYPDARVVLVERDFDKWYKSVVEGVVDSLFGTVPDFFVNTVEPMIGSVAGPTNRKMLLGWAGARDGVELRRRETLRAAWERHHREIREMCAGREGKLLEYRMGDGWEPLCEFLGCAVPRGGDGEVLPFPHANEAAALRKKIVGQQVAMLKKLGRKMAPWVAAAGAVGVAWWARSQGWL
ncbi:hypothetical protein QBC47DRAFT_95779 [Echria macrotheca]|uniref:Uncharacterized protein n=1 Tax=Echria macrotheca TaxID=438768 RepID=A0AAJ0BKG3_9PEZI|nr:hypothetical protein QBC47DRAFT_95779 [Echria macrotheca]